MWGWIRKTIVWVTLEKILLDYIKSFTRRKVQIVHKVLIQKHNTFHYIYLLKWHLVSYKYISNECQFTHILNMYIIYKICSQITVIRI